MTAKQYLEKYRELAAAISAKSEQIDRLREFLTGTSSGGSNGSGGAQPYDRLGDGTGDIVDMEREKNAMVDELVEMQVVIRRNLSKITDPKVRAVIEYRYIDGYSYEEIAESECRDTRTIRYRQYKALRVLESVWDSK